MPGFTLAQYPRVWTEPSGEYKPSALRLHSDFAIENILNIQAEHRVQNCTHDNKATILKNDLFSVFFMHESPVPRKSLLFEATSAIIPSIKKLKYH